MKTNVKQWIAILWKPLIGLIVLAFLVIWTTGVLSDRVEPGVAEHQPGIPFPPDAETFTARLEAASRWVDVVGTVTSDTQVDLSARVSAYVEETLASAGQAVTRNELLIRLDDRELQTQLAAARAELHRTKTDYERTATLKEKQAATEQQWIAAESAYQAAQARKEQAEVNLSYTHIRSPLDGQVADRHVDVGTLAHPGQHLISVYDPETLRLDVPVPVRLVDRLALDDSVHVQLERPDTEVTGRVRRIVGAIDPRSRTQTVQVMLDVEGEKVLPGAFGRLRVPTEDRDMFRVPATAIYRAGQLQMVQVVEDQRVLRRLVKTGREEDGYVEVLAGVQDGDLLLRQPILRK